MAVVVYKCDTCKREIELQQKVNSMERIQRCIITHGCRGKLYQLRVDPDYVRGSLPPDVVGLDNWQQRKVLYNHTQSIERDVWVVEHNLGTYPAVSVFIDRPIEDDLENQQEIVPQDIIIIDPNTIKIVFDRPWSGMAQVIARQSDPNLLQPYVREPEQTIPPYQLSKLGEITVATRISTIGEPTNVNIQVTYTTTQGTNPVITYAADNQPSLNSAWVDYDKVVIKGKIYTVRSFNAIVPEMTSGVIGNGSTFVFTGIDDNNDNQMRNIEPDEVIILLSNEPYEVFDKIDNKFINVTDSTSTNNPFAFFYDSGEFLALQDIVQTTYPPIRSI